MYPDASERRGLPKDTTSGKENQMGNQTNKDIVSHVMTEVFINRNASVVEKYFSPSYKQHNPTLPNGREMIPGLMKSLAADFKYEPGMIVAEGDLVMIHGRYTGWGPKPMVAIDIFLLKEGELVEHWDVMQEDIPAEQTKNGNSMFTNPQETK
jgi:predicted SnoaL-like aldol condensation-catalyzing enzyme